MTQYYQEHPVPKETTDKQAASLRKHYAEHPEECQAISARNIKHFKDPEEHAKISRGLKKSYAENPMRCVTMADSQKKSYAENPKRLIRLSASQKARRESERIAKLPAKVAEQNQAAANLPIPLPDIKKYHQKHFDDSVKHSAVVKKRTYSAKELARQKARREERQAEKRREKLLLCVTMENQLAAARLPEMFKLEIYLAQALQLAR